MRTELKVLGGLTAAIAVVAGAVLLFSGGPPPADRSSGPDSSRLIRSDSLQTNPQGKVQVVEFADFQCPACAAASPQVDLARAKPGVNLVFRHFPLPSHRNAVPAANAAEAAGAQGKFFEMAKVLYDRQPEWGEAAKPGDLFAGYAAQLGLDGAKVKTAVETNQYRDKIERDKEDGQALSLTGTPSFFLNGKPVESTSLVSQVEAALAQP